MHPEDRVLIGVIKRKRDLNHAQDESWYRIPEEQMPLGIHVQYLGFFLSGRVFKDQSGGIHYYAPVHGVELVHRRDLLPAEANHPRAEAKYYRISLGKLLRKEPPILNPSRRAFAFIDTTWDRFCRATTIQDLYSPDKSFVDRLNR